MENYFLVDVYVACVQIFHTLVKITSCLIVGGLILKFPFFIYLYGFLFVLFHRSAGEIFFVIEEI